MHAMCMFDKFHLTFNFESKLPRDVFKSKNKCQLIYTFNLNCHLNLELHTILEKTNSLNNDNCTLDL